MYSNVLPLQTHVHTISTLAKELLNELYMMLCGAQNAARTLSINNQRTGLARNVIALKEKIAFLSGNRNTELSPIN